MADINGIRKKESGKLTEKDYNTKIPSIVLNDYILSTSNLRARVLALFISWHRWYNLCVYFFC